MALDRRLVVGDVQGASNRLRMMCCSDIVTMTKVQEKEAFYSEFECSLFFVEKDS